MALEHLGERRIDRLEQRIDRAVALGRGAPVVRTGLDHDRAAALRVAAGGDGPAGELERRRRVAGWLCCGHLGPSPAVTVVKCRSSRRRSSAPLFQIAYSSESPRAVAEAAMMFVSEPMGD